jgi:O-antigen ligase
MARADAPVALDPPVERIRRPTRSITTVAVEGRRTVLVVGCAIVLAVVVMFYGPVPGPSSLLLVGVAASVLALLLGSPLLALLALLLSSFLRIAVPVPALPSEPMVLALFALVGAAALAVLRGRLTVRFGALEAAMAAYLLWNTVSMLWPHTYPPVDPSTGEHISVSRFILTGTVLPFVAFLVARSVFRTERLVRPMLYSVLALAGYSALVSVLQFSGPRGLVWPRYIVDAPKWMDRAVGVFNQPVVNGLVMVAGFIIGVFLLHERTLARFPRFAALLVAVLCVPGIYLTRTRVVWLVFGIGLLACALFARRARAGFVVTIVVALAFIGLNWSTFTSSDRAAGGVGSTSEVDDRLNSIATSLWAIEQKPVFGWGIGRFTAVNTYQHRVWSPDIDFQRGYAISSHENELGIATELGLVGLALWLAVLVLLVLALVRALRRLPKGGLGGRPLALLAVVVFATWVVCGFTIDLRYCDFANLLVFLLAGAAVGVADPPGPCEVAVDDGAGGRALR